MKKAIFEKNVKAGYKAIHSITDECEDLSGNTLYFSKEEMVALKAADAVLAKYNPKTERKKKTPKTAEAAAPVISNSTAEAAAPVISNSTAEAKSNGATAASATR